MKKTPRLIGSDFAATSDRWSKAWPLPLRLQHLIFRCLDPSGVRRWCERALERPRIKQVDSCWTLPSDELAKLSAWWDTFRAEASPNPVDKDRLTAIAASSGCLAGEESADFDALVTEAGKSIPDDHAW